jgi:CheY-like chemotaxis protein
MREELNRPGRRELVREDDDAVRAYTAEILRELGYSVAEASNAQATPAILGEAEQFDLLLTDVVVPGHMNGRELADEAVRLRDGLWVLFMTGYSRDAIIRHRPLDRGVHVIGKPFVSRPGGQNARPAGRAGVMRALRLSRLRETVARRAFTSPRSAARP